jgi:hypothetical protein
MISAGQITLQRQFAERELLPDTCLIMPAHGANRVVSGIGIATSEAPEPRQWRGQTAVKCRMDNSRAFRPARLPGMTTEVDEFQLELPWDMIPDPSDHIVCKDQTYIIRKMDTVSNFNVTNVLIVTILGATKS